MGLRNAVALEHGADEELLAAAAQGTRRLLTARHAAALNTADAYLGQPGALSPAEWSSLTSQLAPTELAEIALRLTTFSRNKVRVSLGLDPEEITHRVY